MRDTLPQSAEPGSVVVQRPSRSSEESLASRAFRCDVMGVADGLDGAGPTKWSCEPGRSGEAGARSSNDTVGNHPVTKLVTEVVFETAAPALGRTTLSLPDSYVLPYVPGLFVGRVGDRRSHSGPGERGAQKNTRPSGWLDSGAGFGTGP